MGSFSNVSKFPKVDIPRPPKVCTSSQCFPKQRKAFINFIEVEDENYQRKIGLASVLMPQEKASNRRSLDFGLDFKAWHTRCTEHFITDPVDVGQTWTGN